jgi:hypothetical protein
VQLQPAVAALTPLLVLSVFCVPKSMLTPLWSVTLPPGENAGHALSSRQRPPRVAQGADPSLHWHTPAVHSWWTTSLVSCRGGVNKKPANRASTMTARRALLAVTLAVRCLQPCMGPLRMLHGAIPCPANQCSPLCCCRRSYRMCRSTEH